MISRRPPEDMKILNMNGNEGGNEGENRGHISERTLMQQLRAQFGSASDLKQQDEKHESEMDINISANRFSDENNNMSANINDNNNVNNNIIGIQQRLKQKKLLYDTGYRYKRIIGNDLENIPITLILAWGSLYANTNDKITTYCISIFTMCRFIHTYCYIKELQPYRTISYLCGVLSTFIMAMNLVYSVFKKNKT